MSVSEVERALLEVCFAWRSDADATDCMMLFDGPQDPGCQARARTSPLAVVHEALLDEAAVVGDVRRTRLFFDAPTVELDALSRGPTEEKLRQTNATLASPHARCDLDSQAVAPAMLAAAVAASKDGRFEEALDRCADAVALSRDQFLTGNLSDLLIGVARLEQTSAACGPVVEAAPVAAASAFAVTLGKMRAQCPPIADTFDRDYAEMMLFQFGKAYGPTAPPCERAARLAGARHDKLTPEELAVAWAARGPKPVPEPKYEEAYEKSLRALDALITRARAVGPR